MKAENTKVFSHFTTYFIGVILINSAGFILIPLYTRYLPTSEFGVLEILNRCSEIFMIIFSAGLGMTCLSFYSSEKEQKKKNNVVSTAIIAIFVISLCGVIAFQFTIQRINSYFFNTTEYILLFRIISFTMLAELLSIVPLAYIRACMKSRLFVFFATTRFVFILVLNIYLVVFLHMQIKGVIIGNMAGSVVSTVILIGYTLPKTGIQFDMLMFKKMLSFGLPFVPGGLFLFVLNSGDSFFIQTIHNSATLGIYSLGYKIGTLVMVFVLGPFLKIWGPYMFKLDSESEDYNLFGKYFLYLIIAYCSVSLPLALFSKEIIRLLADREYWEAYKVVPYVLVAYLFWSTASFFDSGFYITRKTFYKPFIMGATTILAVVLYWILIPNNGLLGGAYATVISFGVFSLITYLFSNKIYPVRYPLGKFAYILGLGIAIFIIGNLLPDENPLMSLIIKAILVLLYPCIIIATGVLDKGDLKAAKEYLNVIRGKCTFRYVSSAE